MTILLTVQNISFTFIWQCLYCAYVCNLSYQVFYISLFSTYNQKKVMLQKCTVNFFFYKSFSSRPYNLDLTLFMINFAIVCPHLKVWIVIIYTIIYFSRDQLLLYILLPQIIWHYFYVSCCLNEGQVTMGIVLPCSVLNSLSVLYNKHQPIRKSNAYQFYQYTG